MAANKITSAQFQSLITADINSRNSSYDTELGPIPDVIVRPMANVLEAQNDRIRQISLLLTLQQISQMSNDDVDALVYNEALVRGTGGRSSGVVVFSRTTPPTVDIVVQANYPIATLPDESTGQSIIFVTTAAATMFAASSASYYNLTTRRYELSVPVVSTKAGSDSRVGANRIIRPLRALTGFDTVTNPTATSNATDAESNADLVERYKISVLGTQLATTNGRRLFILSNFPDAGDVLVENSNSSFVTRGDTDAGAIDIFITGSQAVAFAENRTFIGLNQLIVLAHQPVVSITSVAGYTQGVDYILVKDTAGYSGSNRAQDGIQFIPGGNSPAIGSSISVTYSADELIETIQSAFNNTDYQVGGQDPLVRQANQVNLTIVARVTLADGFSFSTVQSAVVNALSTFVSTLGLGQDVQQFDLDATVKSVSGVDNFVFVLMDRLGGTGNSDVAINSNEFPRLSPLNITLTQVS